MLKDIKLLFLAAPLVYTKGENIMCYLIEPAEADIFEPNADSYIKSQENIDVIIPAGNYLFSQQTNILDMKEIIETAVELQKEGLWQRLEMKQKLFIRFVSEDGRVVTQIFRPYNAL